MKYCRQPEAAPAPRGNVARTMDAGDGIVTSTGTKTARLAAAGALALALAGCGGAASDFSGADITRMAAGGLGALTGKQVNSAEKDVELAARSPLVPPPDRNLRPPVDPQLEQERLGANWPTDPEEIERKQAELKKKEKDEEFVKQKLTFEGRSRALTPDEMAEATRAPAPERPVDPYQVAGSDVSRALSPEEMKRLHASQRTAQIAADEARKNMLVADHRPLADRPPSREITLPDGQVISQSQESVETAEAPKKKSLWNRLVFWK